MKIFDSFRETLQHELTLLGAPISKGKAIDEDLNKKLEALETDISRLLLLHSHDTLSAEKQHQHPKAPLHSMYFGLL